MEPKNIFIPYASIVDRFDKHISNEQNERIIVSGAFGIGKTTFIRSYFETRQDEYVTIRVSPINYSVSSNDSIFELIKADIIKQLYIQGRIKPKCKLPQDQVRGIVETHNTPELWDNEKEQMDGSADRSDAARA